MLLAVIVALIPCVCRIFPVRSGSAGAASNETDEEVAVRIVGGEITSIKNYPFIVSIQRRYSSHSCGGTYVAPRFVLSAAHCMVRPLLDGTWIAENPRQYYVIAGATYVYLPSWGSMQIELIDKTLPHAEFRFSDMQNDIGLFRLKRPLPKSAHIQYVTIPSQYIANLFDVYTRDCHAVGWGRHIPDSNEVVRTCVTFGFHWFVPKTVLCQMCTEKNNYAQASRKVVATLVRFESKVLRNFRAFPHKSFSSFKSFSQ
ncbi:serine protease 33-like isoform X2 [Pseudomyrmex gracilis]|uniref:serine protease 33-like isoform X2 n=1 Tax=Pseudomyrmex gracilis TaxID=219809 RepID=UPI000994EC17|nr:serine protease 33-like isoform X2 [Pseudomyrmex gracilis]